MSTPCVQQCTRGQTNTMGYNESIDKTTHAISTTSADIYVHVVIVFVASKRD